MLTTRGSSNVGMHNSVCLFVAIGFRPGNGQICLRCVPLSPFTIKMELLVRCSVVLAVVVSAGDPSPHYNWPRDTDHYDLVAAVSANGLHICTAVFVSYNALLSAANPFRAHLSEAARRRLRVHVVHRGFDVTAALPVFGITVQLRSADLSGGAVGFDGRHNTMHDVISLTTPAKYRLIPCEARTVPRTPCFGTFHKYMKLREFPPLAVANWSLASFGFEQLAPLVLMVYQFPEPVLVECDEWLPRAWGHFLCLRNAELIPGCAGAGLFHKDVLVGLGAFELSRGPDAVLVFTDLRPYHLLTYKFDLPSRGRYLFNEPLD